MKTLKFFVVCLFLNVVIFISAGVSLFDALECSLLGVSFTVIVLLPLAERWAGGSVL